MMRDVLIAEKWGEEVFRKSISHGSRTRIHILLVLCGMLSAVCTVRNRKAGEVRAVTM